MLCSFFFHLISKNKELDKKWFGECSIFYFCFYLLKRSLELWEIFSFKNLSQNIILIIENDIKIVSGSCPISNKLSSYFYQINQIKKKKKDYLFEGALVIFNAIFFYKKKNYLVFYFEVFFFIYYINASFKSGILN